jgi:hypothetical protein
MELKAILPEPPSLAHQSWRAMGVRKDGGHPPGEPEQAFMLLKAAMLAKTTGTACWISTSQAE